MTADPGIRIDPANPVFLSYRHQDGTRITSRLAWLLRASGVPVWRDKDDLPPGDTIARLQQAIDDGISGGVLVITPDIVNSKIVRDIEAPRLLALHKASPEFTLGIANAVTGGSTKPNYTEPDRLLGLAPGTLSGVDQQPASKAGLHTLVKGLVNSRIAHLRSTIAADDQTLTISIQTRNTPQVFDRTEGHLDIRLRPTNDGRLPSRRGLSDLQEVIDLLPHSVVRSGAKRVRILGGAHLSVALALGAALPSTRIGNIEIIDQGGTSWTSGSAAVFTNPPAVRVVSQATNPTPRGHPAVAVYADMLPTRSDAAYDRFLDEHRTHLSAWIHLTYVDDEALMDPALAGRIAADLAAHLRQLSAGNKNAEIHLLLRCPFPLAVLLGRLTNTLGLVVYEWDNSNLTPGDYRPRYDPCMRVTTSSGTGVISELLLPPASR